MIKQLTMSKIKLKELKILINLVREKLMINMKI